MFRQTLDQRKPASPTITNDMLREMLEAGDKWAGDVLQKRLKRYSAACEINRENMRVCK